MYIMAMGMGMIIIIMMTMMMIIVVQTSWIDRIDRIDRTAQIDRIDRVFAQANRVQAFNLCTEAQDRQKWGVHPEAQKEVVVDRLKRIMLHT